MPGSQLPSRLHDLHYRIETLSGADQLVPTARSTGPMVVFTDLHSYRADICAVIKQLKLDAATAHIPVIAFATEGATQLQAAAQQAGATLAVNDAALLTHLEQLIEQALQV
ncbi:MAG: hypothetical protein KIS67_18515 [Verrucomicrobiae bacterium]|nr:hypothetical protein [Verrucomicrobiae bacterium]